MQYSIKTQNWVVTITLRTCFRTKHSDIPTSSCVAGWRLGLWKVARLGLLISDTRIVWCLESKKGKVKNQRLDTSICLYLLIMENRFIPFRVYCMHYLKLDIHNKYQISQRHLLSWIFSVENIIKEEIVGSGKEEKRKCTSRRKTTELFSDKQKIKILDLNDLHE